MPLQGRFRLSSASRGLTAPALLALVLLATAAPAAGRGFNRHVCPGPVARAAGCHARVSTDRNGKPLAASGPSGLSPAQFHGAYGLPATGPAGQTIAIVDAFDSPTIESDLGVFSSTFGLPACTTANGCFKKVNQSGAAGPYPSANAGWALEIALDVETAHAICQNCKILLVEATTNGLTDLAAAENTAATLGATVISNSFGGSEFAGETTDTAYNHPGIPITVSAGDSGFGAEYPASSPYVVAVGGTTLTVGASNTYGGEAAWSGSGSGCSAYTSAQAWQTADSHWAQTGCGSMRGVADVAADANPSTGASVYDTTKYQGQSGWFTVGGTSLAAPLIAGVYGLAGGGSGSYPAALPYAHQSDLPAALHDVTSGSNGSCGTSTMCKGAAGYDGPTGVGTPNGLAAFGGPATVDHTPPETTIDSGPSGPTKDATPSFAFHSSEAGSTFECSVSSGSAAFGPCTGPGASHTPEALDDGSYTFAVRATDPSSNTDQSPATRAFSVDTVLPVVGLAAPAGGSHTSDTTPALSGTAGIAAGDSSTVTIKVFAGTGTSGSLNQTRSASRNGSTGAYSVDAAALAPGTYTAQATQSDAAGNTGQSGANTFSIDSQPQTDTQAPSSQAGSVGQTASTSVTVNYSAADSGSGLQSVELWARPPGGAYSKVDTKVTSAGSGSFAYSAGAGDGAYDFYTRARDNSNNYEAAPASADSETQLDTTPPETAIDSGPSGTSADRGPTFGFHASEAGSSFRCSLSAGAPVFGPCSGPGATHTPGAPLADGGYTFEVVAVDQLGNADPTPAARSFTVQTPPPDTLLRRHPPKTVLTGKAWTRVRFGFFSPAAGSSYRCKLDRGGFAPCTSPRRYRVRVGRHRFTVEAVGATGPDPSPARFAFRVLRLPARR
jgi:Bacterial Ig-like domain